VIILPEAAVAELLGDNRLIIWNVNQARWVYGQGFYGKPLGEPRPKMDFDNPLLLDPVEALYLLEKGVIRIKLNGRDLDSEEFKDICAGTFSRFQEKYRVYQDIRSRGYIATPGIKYGCDFAVYENGPGIDHAPYVVQIVTLGELLTAAEIVKAGRLAATVRKSFILAVVNDDIRYLEFNWWKA